MEYNAAMQRGTFWAVSAMALVSGFPLDAFQDGPQRIESTARLRPPAALSSAEAAAIRVDASLVLIPAHVTDSLGAIVSGLTKADFELTEDGIPQTISQFSMDDVPASIGMIYDSSGSMHGKIRRSAAAAEAFFHTANPADEFFLVQVSDRAKLTVPFAAGPDELLSRIARAKPFGRTALFDGLQVAMKQMKHARNSRKALVVISDGGENQSRRNVREIKAALQEADVQLYAVGLFDEDARKQSSEERRGPGLLDELAAETGGRLYPAGNLDDLPSIGERISRDVRTEYVLGYAPPANARDGKYHRVTLTVGRPGMRTYYRQGYYAASN